ncbi:MAG TPA: lipopolysaccharide transport periplasmic protein LptA [Gammaproteobacteria bacterium]
MTRYADRPQQAVDAAARARARHPAGSRHGRGAWPAAALGLLLLVTHPASALDGDRAQPIYLEADSVQIDERTGVSVYRGQVKVTQGSSELRAEQVTVEQSAAGDRIVATGRPATFSQQREERPEPVEGSAARIEHRSAESLLILTGAAEFRQGGDRFSSERIEYDTAKDVVRAGQAASAARPGERVRIVIQPRSGGGGPAVPALTLPPAPAPEAPAAPAAPAAPDQPPAPRAN